MLFDVATVCKLRDRNFARITDLEIRIHPSLPRQAPMLSGVCAGGVTPGRKVSTVTPIQSIAWDDSSKAPSLLAPSGRLSGSGTTLLPAQSRKMSVTSTLASVEMQRGQAVGGQQGRKVSAAANALPSAAIRAAVVVGAQPSRNSEPLEAAQPRQASLDISEPGGHAEAAGKEFDDLAPPKAKVIRVAGSGLAALGLGARKRGPFTDYNDGAWSHHLNGVSFDGTCLWRAEVVQVELISADAPAPQHPYARHRGLVWDVTLQPRSVVVSFTVERGDLQQLPGDETALVKFECELPVIGPATEHGVSGGLHNIGQSCFINATVQLLAGSPSVCAWLEDIVSAAAS